MNLRARVAILTLTTAALAGCATMRVSSFVERGVDFAQLRTYNWAPADMLFTGDPRLDNNAFFQERVQAAVEKQLAAKGFAKVTSSTPDLLLHYHASVGQEIDANGADQRYGYCDNDCRSEVYDAGTILIDFVGGRSNKLVWRGWAEGTLDGVIDNQSWMEETVDTAVERILQRLPGRL